MSQLQGKTVAEIQKGSIKDAALEEGSPSWEEIIDLTWEEITECAKKKVRETFKKPLGSKEYDK